MAEEAARRPEVMVKAIPDHVGAVFETGKNLPFFRDWMPPYEPLVLTKDVLKKGERDTWLLENIRVFSDGTLPSPEEKWKPIVDFWLTELKIAAENAGLEPKDRKETEKDVRAMFAVSSSARAMEQTAGSAAKYIYFMTGMPWRRETEPDLDVQDYWAEFLLHNDPDKLKRVLAHPLVQRYYERLIEEAGIEIVGERPMEKKRLLKWLIKSDWQILDKDRVLKESRLVQYLMGEDPFLEPAPDDSDEEKEEKKKAKAEWEEEKKKTSLNEYIADVLLADEGLRKKHLAEGWSDGCQWAAARLACDTFLVDKYTRWEYELDQRMIGVQEGNRQEKKGIKLMPFPGWGGNPLRAIIEPAFLPRRIKKMYYEEDEAILSMMDFAFRPIDRVSVAKLEKRLPPSMVANLKTYARYSSAHWIFLGASRGPSIPRWTDDTMYKELPQIAELLDQVYGDIGRPESNMGKHILGVMMSRIIQCKALATAVESARPGFRDNLKLLFGKPEIARPFLKVEQYLWGPDLDAKKGFLASLAAGRTRFVFKNNQFEAEKNLIDAWEILSSNDQDPKGRGRAKTLNTIGFIFDIAKAIATGGKQR